jgi:hypothetical protein
MNSHTHTHRANYRAAGRALGQDFENNPDVHTHLYLFEIFKIFIGMTQLCVQLVAQLPWAFQTAGWFWSSRNLNPLADRGDLNGVTRAINGGLNGLANRYFQQNTKIAPSFLSLSLSLYKIPLIFCLFFAVAIFSMLLADACLK